MNLERAEAILRLSEISDYEAALSEIPTLLLLLAQQCADYAKEWEGIAHSKTRDARIRRGEICAATNALANDAYYEATAYMEERGYPKRPSALRTLGYPTDRPPTPTELADALDDIPYLDPESGESNGGTNG